MRLRGKHGLTRTLRLSLLVTALTLVLAAGVAQAGGASFEPGHPVSAIRTSRSTATAATTSSTTCSTSLRPGDRRAHRRGDDQRQGDAEPVEFNLDFVGLTVESIKVDGRAADWSRDGGELTVIPHSGIPKGDSFTTVVRYDGVPEPIEDAARLRAASSAPTTARRRRSAARRRDLVPGQRPPARQGVLHVPDHRPSRARGDRQRRAGEQANAAAAGRPGRGTRRSRWRPTSRRRRSASSTSTPTGGRASATGTRSTRTCSTRPRRAPGDQFAISQQADPVVQAADAHDQRAGGRRDSCRSGSRATPSPDWDFFFVEAHTVGRRRLDDAAATSTATRARSTGFSCPVWHELHPFLAHYQTRQRRRHVLAGRHDRRW